MNRITLPIASWPNDDRDRWIAARGLCRSRRSRVDPASWSPATVANAERAWGTYLSFLSKEQNLEPDSLFDSRINEAAIVQFTEWRIETASLATASLQINALYNFVRAVTGGKPPEWLWAFNLNLKERYQLDRRAPPEPPSPAKLALVGFELMRCGQESCEDDPLRAAMSLRDGLMIALTAFQGFRRRELVELRVERNLVRTDEGWQIVLYADETKDSRYHRVIVNPLLTNPLDEYLAVHRPRLVRALHDQGGGDSENLFVSPRTGRMNENQISTMFSEQTLKFLGKAWSPQSFRRAIASEAVRRDPGLVACAAAVNRHSVEVASVYYNAARVAAADRRFQEILRDERRRNGR